MAGVPLEQLTVESFAPHVGSSFVAQLADGTLPLDLVRAQALGPPPPGGGRAQFALHFRGPGPQVFPQSIYRLEHRALGVLEIFLVPIGRDGDSSLYEAVFT